MRVAEKLRILPHLDLAELNKNQCESDTQKLFEIESRYRWNFIVGSDPSSGFSGLYTVV